jgi:hypothetical protein
MGGAYEGDASRNVLYLNPAHGNDWLTLMLEGTRSNRAALGARIKITVEDASGTREIHGKVSTGGSFGASSLQAEMGLGRISGVRQVEIWWPSNVRQSFGPLTKNHRYRIREGDREASLWTGRR